MRPCGLLSIPRPAGPVARWGATMALLAGLLLTFSPATPVGAAFGITVATTTDAFGGPTCSLRNAIQTANTGAAFGGCALTGAGPGYVIALAAGTYTLALAGAPEDQNAAGDLDVCPLGSACPAGLALTIQGAAGGGTIIQAGPAAGAGIDRVFELFNGAVVTMIDMTIRNGTTVEDGGGINKHDGTLQLTRVTLQGNHADNGGGGLLNSQGAVTLTDCVVNGNTAGAGGIGGGLANNTGGTMVLAGTTVSTNTAGIAGGGLINLGVLAITGGALNANSVPAGSAGGMANAAGGTATIAGLVVTGNSAQLAGGIGNSGTLTLSDSTVSGNQAAAYGGGVAAATVDPSPPAVTNITRTAITDNTAGTDGGGIYNILGARLTLTDATVGAAGHGNTATTGNGGGIANGSAVNPLGAPGPAGGGPLVILRGVVAANAAPNGNGGGIASLSDTLQITGATVQGNQAGNSGGGILNDPAGTALPAGTATLSGTTVGANSAPTGGGLFNSGTLTVTGGAFSGNTAQQVAGLLNNDGGTAVVSGVTVSGNMAQMIAGGIGNAGTLTLNDSTVAANGAPIGGGVAEVKVSPTSAGATTINRSAIVGNTATIDGGGIFNGNGASLTLTDSTVGKAGQGNSATGSGGGIANGSTTNPFGGPDPVPGGPVTIVRSTLSENQAATGGGFAQSGAGAGTTTLTNSTVSNNTATGGEGGGIAALVGTMELRYVTVARGTSGVAAPGGGLTLDHVLIANTTGPNCAGPLVSAGYNVASGPCAGLTQPTDKPDVGAVRTPIGPLAVNAPGVTATHALLQGNVAIDIGGGVAGVAEDQRGVARPQGAAVDAGAYETAVVPPDLTIAKSHSGGFVRGQGGVYTLTVTNIGGGPTISAVTVTDALPTGLTGTAIGGTGWTCALATLSCTRADPLPPSGSYPAITLTVGVATTAPAAVTNTATVAGGGEINTANDSAADLTAIGAGPVTAITVTGPNLGGTYRVGETAQLHATATYADGSTQEITAGATWAPSEGVIASVDGGGIMTAKTPGTATITATFGGMQGRTMVTVVPPTFTGVQPAPAPASRPGGASVPPGGAPTPAPAPPAR